MYRAISKLGSVIEVRGWWRPKLFINDFPQTQWVYRRDWKTIMRKSKIDQLPNNGSALLLGLGGGDVIKILTRKNPNLTITAVELESEVIAVADRYFGIKEGERLEIVVQDAKVYVERNRRKYDSVIVDLYSGDDVPKFVTSKKFLQDLGKSLKPKAEVIFNYASHSFRDNDFAEFERKLKSVFGSVTRLKTWGHTYFLASKV